MKKYELVLFDIDGTLLDFEKAERMGMKSIHATGKFLKEGSLLWTIYWLRDMRLCLKGMDSRRMQRSLTITMRVV